MNALQAVTLRTALTLLLLASCGSAALAQAPAAETPDPGNKDPRNEDPRSVARAILEDWELNFAALREKEARYESARAAAPDEATLPLAMAIVRARHSMNKEALADTAAYLKLRPNDPSGLRMHAWLNLILGESQAALLDAEELSQHLPPPGAGKANIPPDALPPIQQPPANGQPVDGEVVIESEATAFTTDAYVRFLGVVFGYLRGPREDAIPLQQLLASRDAVLGRLTDDQRKTFEAAEEAVEKQYTLFVLNRDQMVDDARQSAEQFNALETQRLLQERQNLAADRAALADKDKALAASRDAALATLDAERSKIQQAVRELDAVASDLQRQIVSIEIDASRLFALADNTNDRNLARRYRIEANNLLRLQDARRFDLNNANGQLGAAQGNLRGLDGQRRDVLGQYQNGLKQLKRDLGKLDARERRISRDLEQLSKPPTGNTPTVRNTFRRAQTIVTYVALPLDAMRKRLQAELAQ